MKAKKPYTPENVARQAFSEHVQSIAFSLTLSRHMIAFLELVRNIEDDDDLINWYEPLRGLVIHDPYPRNGQPHYRLSRAGELVCELLVEAKLIAPKLTGKEKISL